MKRITLVVALCLSACASAWAGEGTAAVATEPSGSPFSLDPVLDGIIVGSVGALDLAVLCLDVFGKADEGDLGGKVLDASGVNGFDRLLMSPYNQGLDLAGTGLEIASVLMPAILLSAPKKEWFTIGTMYAETMLMAWGFKELGKTFVGRARPYLYFEGYPEDEVAGGDGYKSFPSGHATLAFAAASFLCFTYGRYYPDSSWKLPVIMTSYAVASATAAFRLAGGNHFMTDVAAGAAIGTLCGFAVPWLHTLRPLTFKGSGSVSGSVSLQVLPGGLMLSILSDGGRRSI